MTVAAAEPDERVDLAAGVGDDADVTRDRLAVDRLAVHVGQGRRVDGRHRARHHRRDVVAGRVLGVDPVEVGAQAADDRDVRRDAPLVLREHADVTKRRVRHPHRPRDRRRPKRPRRREHLCRRPARTQRDLADLERGGGGEPAVAALVAVEGGAGREHVVLRRRDHGLQVDAGRPHALLGLRQDRQPHHADREERHRGRRRELHRQRVLQRALDALVVDRQRQVGEPRRHRLRLVARRDLVEVALGQRRRVEEVRRREVRKADVLDTPALPAHAHPSSVAELEEAGGVDEVALGLRVRDGVVGAHVRCVEGVGEGVEREAEVVVDGVGLVDAARGEERARVFDVELAGRVVAVVLGAGLHPDGVAGRGCAHGHAAAAAVFVRAVVGVGAVDPLHRRRERRLVGDDVHRAGERVRPIQQRAGAVHHLDAADAVHRDEPHFRAGPIGGLARGVEAFAVDEHEHAGRVEAAQARPHAEGPVAHVGDVGGQRQRVAGGDRVGLLQGGGGHRVDVQRDLPDLTFRARRGHADGAGERPEFQGERQLHRGGVVVDHDRTGDLGERGAFHDHEEGAGTGHGDLEPAVGAGRAGHFLARGHRPHHDPRVGQRGARAIRHHAADCCRHRRPGPARQGQQHHHDSRTHLATPWKRTPAAGRAPEWRDAGPNEPGECRGLRQRRRAWQEPQPPRRDDGRQQAIVDGDEHAGRDAERADRVS